PVKSCEYNFPVNSLKDFFYFARTLETAVTSAYGGAIRYLYDKALITPALGIATVEARDIAWINEFLGYAAAPYSHDTPLTPKQKQTLASTVTTYCPIPIDVTPNYPLTAKITGTM